MESIKTNKTAMAFAVVFILALALMMGMQGCSIDRIVKHDVPADMRELNGGEVKVSLADSPFLRDRFVSQAEMNLSQYDLAAEEARMFAQFLNSAVSFGIQELGTSALPGGTMLLGLIGMLGTLYLPKPGTGQKLMQEKEASFNAGMQRALKMAEGQAE